MPTETGTGKLDPKAQLIGMYYGGMLSMSTGTVPLFLQKPKNPSA
jgi:hypothetical protein